LDFRAHLVNNARMFPPVRRHGANVLTTVRILLAPAFVGAARLAAHEPVMALAAPVVFVVAAASDVFDGRLARRWGSASNAGRTFDHLADIGFILTALLTYAGLGIAPWWVPAAVGGSFAFYVLDSWARASVGVPSLIGSCIGHAAGVLNYGLIGVLVFNNTAAIGLLPAALLEKLFWLVPFYSTAAVIARLATRWSPAQRTRVAAVPPAR